ncbi:tRNA (N(6)-L-threonylcarbamoyladenosine(37)-C(2))-methylthiotransferase MtaB [Rickettsiales endosymbiont of Trichoplax sp. H2]|uniref:tRNA (N(6)-L-threonylcarbamoyladenosine(37)-C(2))- methylthiotransferase MtaB n=1 Tax=Rickettsiales endosymbiont of Trichoplax sp. H2 TaxID=2021221 RepID=UPI0012B283D0|nr:tRNA (N(6)-L-threonylcarbamoyladenosine(37)-C(2))-methylthiotransferase MtaB [Rickettsiales endosymbiont of Trichoplax sp. H2]MSO13216.1 Threonylcarbamoyladenosine tRNA methylthiotransferase MtaB [Rickettsiales endosymbiont of Trichoplax sp. H2]
MSVEVVTFGCRLNIYESELIEKHAKNAGINNAIIFNSCAVTKEAERKLKQAIRKARSDNPNKKILVTGCAAQVSAEKYANMIEVDKVFGNHEKLEQGTYKQLLENSEAILVNDIMSVKETAHQMIDGIQNKSKAFLQIQNGCNHRCTFCIIPYGRGNSRSVPVGEIVKYAQNLVDQGYKELVLTGVDITDYGLDLPGKPSLGNMINRLFKMVPDIKRLRLSSIDVAEIDDELFDIIINESRFMPHLHLSLQAGDDMILKRMKRRHRRQQVINFCNEIWKHRSQVVLGADVIAGFPTETDEMFKNTYDLIEQLRIVHLHVFPYSLRDNTPAARMPQIESSVIKDRAKKLRNLKQKLMHQYLKDKIGKEQIILAESNNYGYTEDYFKVYSTKNLQKGEIYKLKIKSIKDNQLII